MTRHDFEGARCIGRHWTFDSNNYAEHREAAALCNGQPGTNNPCPVRDNCAQQLLEIRQQPASHRPVGTWAGQLVGGPPQQIPCGTESAYHRHIRNDEPIDDACRAAHSAHAAAYYQRKKAERGAA